MLKKKANAYGTITSTILAGDPRTGMTINLTAGQGARLPSISGATEWFPIDLINSTGRRERFLVTARSTDTLTANGTWEGTTAKAFSSGDRFEMVHCLTDYIEMLQVGMVNNRGAIGGTADALTMTLKSGRTALEDGFRFVGRVTSNNTSSAPTLALSLDAGDLGGSVTTLSALTIKRGNNQPVGPGDLRENYDAEFEYHSGWGVMVLLNPANTMEHKTGAMMDWPGRTAPAWALARNGQAVSRSAYVNLMNVLCPVLTGATTSGSKSVTGLSSTADFYIGMPIESAGNLAAGSTVESIVSSTAITVSINATATSGAASLTTFPFGAGDGSTTFNVPDDRDLFMRGWGTTARGLDTTIFTGTTTSGANTVTGLSSTDTMYVGQALSAAAGIPGGTTVSGITSATAITMSANATASGSRSITFTGKRLFAQQDDDNKSHNHATNAGSAGGAGLMAQATSLSGSIGTSTSGGPEARPKNRGYLPIIVF